MRLVLMGPPGAGKGTQAVVISRLLGVPHISTGDMLRDGIRTGLPVALVAKARIDRGELVDDETMIAIVGERLNWPDAARGAVLDGFPRTVSQARALDGLAPRRADACALLRRLRSGAPTWRRWSRRI